MRRRSKTVRTAASETLMHDAPPATMETIMSTFLRSLLVIAIVAGGTSAAYATSYGSGYGYGWAAKKQTTRAFFDQLRKNSN